NGLREIGGRTGDRPGTRHAVPRGEERTMPSHNDASSPASLDDRIDALAANLKNLVSQMSTTAAEVKGRAIDVKQRASSSAGSLAARAGRVIQDHPIAAIGVAFGVGYLVMRLIRR
ncbi:MAG TPA: hypothetical protein VF516_40935, partial [Kofleriaceae bacterium]